MTDRLYYTDAYLTSFEARVVAREDEGRRVYLDRTAFYPTSGGQPFDTGRLGDSEVVDVVDEGERIAHLLRRSLSNDQVQGQIDWNRRFDHMQQHTAQHLLSAVFADRFGLTTTSVRFGDQSSTLDLDTDVLTPEQSIEVEGIANRVVSENRPVTVEMEDAKSVTGLRKPSEREGRIRVVTIRALDRSACGGTHVRATGEIGAILIRRIERVKKSARVEFLAGQRATRQARHDFQLLSGLAAGFSAAPDEVPGLVEGLRQSLKAAEANRREAEIELNRYRARERHQATHPDAQGRRRVVERRERGALEELRGLAQAVIELPKSVFVGAVADPPAVLLAASADSGVDAGATLKPILTAAGGKGGGSARLAQGSLPNLESLEAVLKTLQA